MLKLRKVYTCDCCGKVGAPSLITHKFGIPYKYRPPFDWENILGKWLLCPDCAYTYHIINDMCRGKNPVETKLGIFIPKKDYEYTYDNIQDEYIIRRIN